MYLSKATIITCFMLFCLPVCAYTTIPSIPGISGIARMSSNTYLIVQDAKDYEQEKPRIGLINIKSASESIEYKRLYFPATASSISNDLEGVCRVPNRSNEFLLAESGYWKEKYGRVFHIRVTGDNVELVHELKLPLLRDNNPDQRNGDQFEGIACTTRKPDEVLILLGERGGTDVYPKGILRWGTYSLRSGSVIWSEHSIEVSSPNPWGISKIRSITGLSIDSKKRLWGSASVDPGDDGPFRSVVYQIGHVDAGQKIPVQLHNPDNYWIVEGFKVEGVSAGENGLPLSIGTEDENYGGIWRPMPELNSIPD